MPATDCRKTNQHNYPQANGELENSYTANDVAVIFENLRERTGLTCRAAQDP
jgi:hypothetical protein